jgi:hypothetical protein
LVLDPAADNRVDNCRALAAQDEIAKLYNQLILNDVGT